MSCLVEMPVNIIRSLGLQRGKNDRVDAHRIALYAYKNRDDVKLWKPQRDVILQTAGPIGTSRKINYLTEIIDKCP